MSETQGVEIPKTMLILKSNPTALLVVETFLRNRGWKIYSTSNLKEALVQIISNRPSYVLLSVDHPNKKVRVLPKILAQALPVACITFAENQNSMSFKMLNETATDYRVYPPVTGPAIERSVNKYLKDQQTQVSLQAAKDTFGKNDSQTNGDVISVKGGDPGSIEVRGAGDFTGDAGKLFAQFLSEDGPQSTDASTQNRVVDNNHIFATPVDDEEDRPHLSLVPNENSANTEENLLPSYLQARSAPANDDLGGVNGFGKTYVQKGTQGPAGQVVPPNDNIQPPPPGPSDTPPFSGWSHSQNNGSLPPKGYGVTPPEGLGSREYRRRQAASNWTPMVDDREYVEHIRQRRALSDANQTLIARGAQKSLEESVTYGDGKMAEAAQLSTRAACIIVESGRFSGYLVAVMGKNRKIDQSFIESVRTKLFNFLKDNGEDVKDGEGLEIKIRQVDFEPWALEYAEFLRKSVHQGNEVAMAFFPRRPIKAILEDSHDKHMAKIHLNELEGDRQVEFDLYMYLPTNNKYVLYTPKGGIFYNKQLDRLKNQGVTHMHVQRDAVLAISKYQAQNYLNNMIEDHEQRQEELLQKAALAAKVRAA